METIRLRKLQHPRRAEDLLESFIQTQLVVPPEAQRISSSAELPRALRQLVGRGDRAESAWRAWSDGVRVWFFDATLLLEQSRERGTPVLQVRILNEEGALVDSLTCIHTREHKWRISA
jgi:hypothetical protein